MTFKGDKIVGKPTLALIEIYIAEQGLFCEPQECYDYWEGKGWLTKKGVEPKSIEVAVHVFNSIAVQREVRKQLENTQFKDKNEKQEREREIIESLKRVKKIKVAPQANPYLPYRGQLSDERWKAFRLFVLKVRGEKCEVCGTTKNLQVHHLQYRSSAMAWEYNCNEVMVLCKDCHKKIHNIK